MYRFDCGKFRLGHKQQPCGWLHSRYSLVPNAVRPTMEVIENGENTVRCPKTWTLVKVKMNITGSCWTLKFTFHYFLLN